MAQWSCIQQCGACCYLEPAERPDLADYLTAPELEQYQGLVGPDGWCVQFDPETRQCRIYDQRPRFCRVEPAVFHDLYGLAPEEVDEFAIACCQEQIGDQYGPESPELQRFLAAVGLPSLEVEG